MPASDQDSLQKSMAVLARDHVAPDANWLLQAESIPDGIWHRFGSAGLAGITLPETFGGCCGETDRYAGSYLHATDLAYTLAEEGDCYGLAASWLGAQLIARHFLTQFAGPFLQGLYLRPLAEGRLKAAVAISEAGAGAHPKHLTTTASRDSDGLVLTGEKAFVTNGPVADIFIVFAITKIVDGQKRYSAFVVPRDAAGLSIAPMPEIDFLKPSSHCHVKLDHVRVGMDAALLHPGEAYERMALPFRHVEDSAGIAVKAGALSALLRRLVKAQPDMPAQDTGEMLCRIAGLRAIGRAAVSALQSEASSDAPNKDLALLTHAALLNGADIIKAISHMAAAVLEDEQIARRLNDLEKSLTIARSARQLQRQKIGSAWQRNLF